MFYYFGAKKRIAHLYPPPRYDRIIEPFAGAAGYSMRHWQHKVWINELDDRIYRLWVWLQQAPPRDILMLPRPAKGVRITSTLGLGLCAEQEILLRLYSQPASFLRGQTNIRANAYSQSHIDNLHKLAYQVPKIRHWKITNLHYRDVANEEATWFIDPPYQELRLSNEYSENRIDYTELAAWCRERQGQVIVCEGAGATWLPFRRFKSIPSNHGWRRAMEMIWTNE